MKSFYIHWKNFWKKFFFKFTLIEWSSYISVILFKFFFQKLISKYVIYILEN